MTKIKKKIKKEPHKEIEQAIRDAIKGGYKISWYFNTETPSQIFFCDDGSPGMSGEGGKVLGIFEKEKIFLDPLFWQALFPECECERENCDANNQWKYKWHSLIDHLATQRPISEFFSNLK